MDREGWQATIHGGLKRVRLKLLSDYLVTKHPQITRTYCLAQGTISVSSNKGEESEKEHICIIESLCYTHETNTAL